MAGYTVHPIDIRRMQELAGQAKCELPAASVGPICEEIAKAVSDPTAKTQLDQIKTILAM